MSAERPLWGIQEKHPLWRAEFPRASQYDPDWILAHQMGPNVLWLTEWLCQAMELRPGMRVLDMGCGKGLSSIFMARELGLQVWANDLWIKPGDNWKRVCEAGLQDQICPIQAEARSLPYAEEFFDAILCVDSYIYFGTDDMYLDYFSKFVKPGGQIGIVVPGLTHDFAGPVPEYLTRTQQSGGVFWGQDCWCFHTPQWWQHLWARTGLVQVELAEAMPEGWKLWMEWEQLLEELGANHFPSDVEALAEDQGRHIGLLRMVARRAYPSLLNAPPPPLRTAS